MSNHHWCDGLRSSTSWTGPGATRLVLFEKRHVMERFLPDGVVLSELLAAEAVQIAGPKGKHIEGRTHHHWGTGTTPVSFGGRHVSLPHPRVRARGKGRGREVALPSIEALRDGDPMTDRVVEQIALGVSTRGYERSLEPVDDSIETRGASKSNASRVLIDATTEKLAQFVSRKLDDVDLVAMFIDGIEFARHSV